MLIMCVDCVCVYNWKAFVVKVLAMIMVCIYSMKYETSTFPYYPPLFVLDQPTVFFDTQQVSKPDSDHPLNAVSH